MLYVNNESLKGYFVQIIARYCGKCIQVQPHTDDSRRKGAVVYIDGATTLSGGNAIAFYLANSQFRGNDLFTQSKILEWISISDNHILPSVGSWVISSEGKNKNLNKDSVKESKDSLLQIMKVLNDSLSSKKYLTQDKLSLGDIAVFVALLPAYESVFNAEIRKEYLYVDKWFENILQEPNVKSVISNFKYCDKK